MNAQRICTTCTGSRPGELIKCESLDCPWLYSRKRAESKRGFLDGVEALLDSLNDGVETDALFNTIETEEIEGEETEWEIEYLVQTPSNLISTPIHID